MNPNESISTNQTRDADFVCAFCGDAWPWSDLAGFDLPRRYCESCIRFGDALEMPRDDGGERRAA